MNTTISKRQFLKWSAVGVCSAGAALIGRLSFHLAHTAATDVSTPTQLPPNYVDDASRLNVTRVKRILQIPDSPDLAERQLASLIKEVHLNGGKVALAGSKHTMGGHTIYPDGIIVDMTTSHQMSLDEHSKLLNVQSGATWAQVIEYLDPKGYSVGVMQSNNDFTVGGTLSANAHGWQVNHAPIASTVQSFRLLLASGEIVNCSRTENSELFSLTIGGYGLFGIIFDIQLQVVRNKHYIAQQVLIQPSAFQQYFADHIDGHRDIDFFFARLSIEKDDFLNEVLVYTFENTTAPVQPLNISKGNGSKVDELKRLIVRGSVGSSYGKWLRWETEKLFSEQMGQTSFTRNELLNKSAQTILAYSEESTSILHEYFIPYSQFNQFTDALRTIVQTHAGDLINVTIRDVKADNDSYMHYAQGDRFAFVLLFEQSKNTTGEQAMQQMTQALIEAALKLNGSYYLPYRLHATQDQFQQAYPMANSFFNLKRKYDPNLIFQNIFYTQYS